MVTPRDIGWWEYFIFFPPLTFLVYMLSQYGYLTFKVSLILFIILVVYHFSLVITGCGNIFIQYTYLDIKDSKIKVYVLVSAISTVVPILVLTVLVIIKYSFHWYLVIFMIEIVFRIGLFKYEIDFYKKIEQRS